MRRTRPRAGSMLARAALVTISCLVVSQGLTTAVGVATQPARRPSRVSAADFTDATSTMDQFRELAAEGSGKVAVILPDAAVAALDGADFARAFRAAGLGTSQVAVQDAGGSDAAQFADAQHDVTGGARVLVLDPINSGVGTQIEAYAQGAGVETIDFDELSLGGSRAYFVGYDDVAAGRLLLQGLAGCLAARHVRNPHIVVMPGPADDGTAAAMAEGYEPALRALVRRRHWVVVAQTVGTGDPTTAASEFQAVYEEAHGVNAVLDSDDATAGAVIEDLHGLHVAPGTVPTTGSGATLAGLQQTLEGAQCGTIYSPPAREAQEAAALALYLRAHVRPPSSLVNANTDDAMAGVSVPSVLVNPQWVTTANMATTVVKNGDVAAARLCAGVYERKCAAAGIKP